MANSVQNLDPREKHHRIASHHPGLRLFLRHLPPRPDPGRERRAVLYVHGATFPSALSIAHRFDGLSWRDSLCAAGFDVWGLDFLGYGASDRFSEMAASAEAAPPPGRAEDASRQIEHAVRFILSRQALPRLSIIAHSWGTIATGRFAARRPDLVDRLVFFGPILHRPGSTAPTQLPAWRLVSIDDQWRRFIADTPPDQPGVLLERHFHEWSEAFLDSDPASRDRSPPAVRVPSGPSCDIAEAWAGRLAYDPARIVAPLLIVRGAWDSLCTSADAEWLSSALPSLPSHRDVRIARAGHLMHLEEMRFALYRESELFLRGGDIAPEAAHAEGC